MKGQVWLEIVAQDDTDVHAAKGIDVDADFSSAQCRPDRARPIGVGPTRQHLGRAGKRVCIPQEYDVETLASEQAGGGTCRALSSGAIQHFNLYPLHRTHRSSRDGQLRCWGRSENNRRRDKAYCPSC
jgi:hypothetical protein